MIRKTVIAAAFGLAMLAGGTSAARADVDIDINLGFGGFYGKGISCSQGKRIVDRRFNRVVARDCKGSRFDYTGRRSGKWYRISVSSATGRITSVRRWYR
jgi:hypothetical protein